MIYQTLTFETEFAARKFMREFLDQYAGQFNPYDGRATLKQDKASGMWEVSTSRNGSAD